MTQWLKLSDITNLIINSVVTTELYLHKIKEKKDQIQYVNLLIKAVS